MTLASALLTPALPLPKKGSIIAAKPVLTAILKDPLVVVTRAVLVTAKFLVGNRGYACLSCIQEPGLWHETVVICCVSIATGFLLSDVNILVMRSPAKIAIKQFRQNEQKLR